MLLGQFHKVEKHRAEAHAPAADVVVAAHEAADVLAEVANIEVARHLNQIQVDVGHPLPLPLGEGEEELDHLSLLRRVEAPYHAEVEQSEFPIGSDKDIARVGVAVEDTIYHDLLHISVEQLARDGLAIQRRYLFLAHLREVLPFDEALG